jgi:hypothetical protein
VRFINFIETEWGSSKPWLKLSLLILAFVAGSLIVYAIQHIRMKEIRETLHTIEKEHIKEVARLQETHIKQISELERSLKSSTVIVESILPDGTVAREIREDVDLTENIKVRTEVVEKIVEVIKEVIVEKEVVKEVVITEPCPVVKPYSFGVSTTPFNNSLNPQFNNIKIDYRHNFFNRLEISPYFDYKPFDESKYHYGLSFTFRL